MSLLRRDVVFKAIQQCNETLDLVGKLRKADETDHALHILQDHIQRIIGPLDGMIQRVTGPSVVMLMGDPERARAYGLLLAAEAEVLHALERNKEAISQARRAGEVLKGWQQHTRKQDDEQVVQALLKVDELLAAR